MDKNPQGEEALGPGMDRGARVRRAGAVIAMLLLGLVLRLETMHQRPLWWDELVTYRISTGTQTPEEDLEHPVLHPLIVSLLVGSIDAITAIRLPSVVFGVVSVALLTWVGRVLFSLPVGLLSAFMLATSIYHIYYSQDGRAYSLLVMLMLGQYLLLFYYLHRRRAATLVAFALLGSMNVYAHHLGLLVQAQLLMTLLGWVAVDLRNAGRAEALPRVRALIPIAISFAAIALAYLPQAFRTLRWASAMQEGAGRFQLVPSLRFFHELFARWGSGPGWPLYVYELFLVLGFIQLLRSGKQAMVLLPCLGTPFVVFAVVPFSHFFDIRYVVTALPAFYLIVSLGAARSSESLRSWLNRLGIRDRVAARLAFVALISPALIFGIANGLDYLTFRRTTVRCSEFFRQPEILEVLDGFCRDHILLNSLIEENRYILSRVE